MDTWDRSDFATMPEELEIEEAIRALQRVIASQSIKNSTRVSLCMALDVLRADKQ